MSSVDSPKALAWLGALLLGAGGLAACPGLLGETAARPLVVVLVDLSASASRTRTGYADWLADQVDELALRAERRGAELALVHFARDVRVLADAERTDAARATGRALEAARRGADGEFPPELESRLAGAAAAAELLFAPGGGAARPGELVLLGDGSYTGADPGPALDRLAARGVQLELRAPPAPDATDLVLAELRLADELEEGAPLACELRLALRGRPPAAGDRAKLEVVLTAGDGPPQTIPAPSVLLDDLPVAGALVRLELGPTPAGWSEVAVTCRLNPRADPVPENDRARASVRAGDERVVACVFAPDPSLFPSAAADWSRFCSDLGSQPGLQVLERRPEELAAVLGSVDAVASYELPLAVADELGLTGFVAAGGGWIATGGDELLAGPLPSWAPLAPEPEPERRVLLLVDGSGSMAGEPFEQLAEAVLEVMRLAPASERFELWVFTDHIESRHDLGRGGPDRARAASALLGARLPRGPTDALAALAAAAAEAAPGSVVLVSDGRDQLAPEELALRATALRARLAEAGARLAVVGVGAELDAEALAALAGGDDWLSAGQARAGPLAALLEGELGRERWRALPEVRAVASEGLRDDVTQALARAFAGQPVAPLARARRARCGPRGEAVLVDELGGALLALAQHGRGRVAALASAPVTDLGGAWSGRAGPLASVVRALARRSPGARLAVGTGASGEPVLEGAPADWPAWVRVRSGGEERRFGTPAAVPGGDARARRSARPGASSGWPEAASRMDVLPPGGEPELLARLGPGSARPPPELSDDPPRLTGRGPGFGSAWPGAAEEADPKARPSSGHPAGPWLVAGGLALLLAALALGWDGGGRFAGVAGPGGRGAGR